MTQQMAGRARVEAKYYSKIFIEAFVEAYDILENATKGSQYEMSKAWIRDQASIIAHKAVDRS